MFYFDISDFRLFSCSESVFREYRSFQISAREYSNFQKKIFQHSKPSARLIVLGRIDEKKYKIKVKTLYILRHAKSSWDNPNLADFDRPLNERGFKAAPFMGKTMARNSFQPDLILSSPAERARQTAMLVKKAGNLTAEIKYNEKIYEASPLRLIEIVSELENKICSVMLVGHNPGFEGLVKILTGEIQSMPTAALAVIDLKTDDWKDVSPDCCALRVLIRPKEAMKSFGAD